MTMFKSTLAPALFISLALSTQACNSQSDHESGTAVDTDSDTDTVTVTSTSVQKPNTLDEAETTHLIFMREEEKLARDVYLTLSTMYPDADVFQTIGEGSEQTHTDVIRDKLEDYDIEDPNPDTDILPSSIGIYTGEEYGVYFTEKYMLLINKGSQSELDALYVGAFIEELDMHDIVECPKAIVEADNGISDCGLNYTDEQPLINTYSSLVDGSQNHLRAFVGRIESIIGVGNYEAQVISQEELDAILGR